MKKARNQAPVIGPNGTAYECAAVAAAKVGISAFSIDILARNGWSGWKYGGPAPDVVPVAPRARWGCPVAGPDGTVYAAAKLATASGLSLSSIYFLARHRRDGWRYVEDARHG